MITKKDLERMFHKETGMMKKVDEGLYTIPHPDEYNEWVEDKLIELLNKINNNE